MEFIQHQHRTQAVVPTRCRHAPPRGPRASTQATPYQLTVREFEVLVLLCEGLRNAAIAARLFRSVRTIDHHLAAVFAKLNVCSRTEAVATALRECLHARELGGAQRNLGKLAVVPDSRPADTAVAAESCRDLWSFHASLHR